MEHELGRRSWNQDCQGNINNLNYANDNSSYVAESKTKELLDEREEENIGLKL